MREVETESYQELRNAVSVDWIEYLDARGCLTFPLPNIADRVEDYLDAVRPDAVILTGGEGPSLDTDGWLRRDADGQPQNARDRMEIALLEVGIARGLPILAVCRGSQLVNVHFGGRIEANISAIASEGHVATRHPVEIVERDVAALIGTSRFVVNSYHDNGIRSEDLAPNLMPYALTEDGSFVEGFFDKSRRVFAMMWHPERDPTDTPEIVRLVDHALILEGE